MSSSTKFVSRYFIDGYDDVEECESNSHQHHNVTQAKKRKHRTKLYRELEDKGNTFRGALISFGHTKIIKAKCPSCSDIAFVSTQFKFLCCGATYEHEPIVAENATVNKETRKQPSKATQQSILRKQKHCCLYCRQGFGFAVKYYGTTKLLEIHWDHLVPYSYTLSCEDNNFVAACGFCNRWKGNKIFKSLIDARTYLLEKWADARS